MNEQTTAAEMRELLEERARIETEIQDLQSDMDALILALDEIDDLIADATGTAALARPNGERGNCDLCGGPIVNGTCDTCGSRYRNGQRVLDTYDRLERDA